MSFTSCLSYTLLGREGKTKRAAMHGLVPHVLQMRELSFSGVGVLLQNILQSHQSL
jgi:hypothetical protein